MDVGAHRRPRIRRAQSALGQAGRTWKMAVRMTYARTVARRFFRASAYALFGRERLLQLELLILEIACLDAWLAVRYR